jgi:hypothetical protein
MSTIFASLAREIEEMIGDRTACARAFDANEKKKKEAIVTA